MESAPRQESVAETQAKLTALILQYEQAETEATREQIKEVMRPIYENFLPDNLWSEKESEDPNYTENTPYDEQDSEWRDVVDTKKTCARILQTDDNWNKE